MPWRRRRESNAATGTRTNVWKAFHSRSNTGILSAKNSIKKSDATQHPITYQLESRCRDGGRGIHPACARRPSVATVAYTFSPAAKLIAVRAAKSSLDGILTGLSILNQPAFKRAYLSANRPFRVQILPEINPWNGSKVPVSRSPQSFGGIYSGRETFSFLL